MNPLPATRERFLKSILVKVPPDRIAEIHVFAPIKQGGVESGVAVVAAWPEAVAHPDEAVTKEAVLAPRPVIYTARYRLTLKGLDRGKWETNIVAEADAPLVTLDAVVRGVQRRAGDVDEPTRMEGDEVRGYAEAFAAAAAVAPIASSVSRRP
jgi:hypothetical protein